jgi:hypothetical protein
MGEAKRRKQLDPNFGKAINSLLPDFGSFLFNEVGEDRIKLQVFDVGAVSVYYDSSESRCSATFTPRIYSLQPYVGMVAGAHMLTLEWSPIETVTSDDDLTTELRELQWMLKKGVEISAVKDWRYKTNLGEWVIPCTIWPESLID